MPYRHTSALNLYAMFYEMRRKLNEITASYWVDLELYNWLNDAQLYIARKAKCLKKTVTVTTVADTQEYDLKDEGFEDIIDISEDGVYFYQNGTTYNELDYTTKWKLNRESPGWRGVSSSTPTKYYYDKASKTIGLYPKPNSSNAGAYLFVGGYYKPAILLAGTASSGSTTSIIFPAGSSTVSYPNPEDDYYNNIWLEIYSGTGAGQKVEITDYAGSTRTATISITTAPDSTSVFGMVPEVPEEMHYLMPLYGIAKAFEKGGSRSVLAKYYWEQFYAGLNLAIAETIEEDSEELVRESYK